MDKFPDIFKATVAVFHGIIATWIFLEFRVTQTSEFYFLILVVFFAVANILIWHLVLRLVQRSRWWRRAPVPSGVDWARFEYRPGDVVVLTLIAVFVGLGAAYLQNKDALLFMANRLTDWERSTSKPPFEIFAWGIIKHRSGVFDRRDPRLIKTNGDVYLRIYIKDLKFGYEGYPSVTPSKLEVREIILSPACRFTIGDTDPATITSWHRIEGPGVFLRLVDTAMIEILDDEQSGCAKLP